PALRGAGLGRGVVPGPLRRVLPPRRHGLDQGQRQLTLAGLGHCSPAPSVYLPWNGRQSLSWKPQTFQLCTLLKGDTGPAVTIGPLEIHSYLIPSRVRVIVSPATTPIFWSAHCGRGSRVTKTRPCPGRSTQTTCPWTELPPMSHAVWPSARRRGSASWISTALGSRSMGANTRSGRVSG